MNGTEGKLHLSVATDYASFATIDRTVSSFLEQQRIPQQSAYIVNLALEEVVTNLIKHGGGDCTNSIDITIEVTAVDLRICIDDRGRPFDPCAAPEADLDKPLEQRSRGGMGLHLLKAFASTMAYRRQGDKNRLILHIPLRANPPP